MAAALFNQGGALDNQKNPAYGRPAFRVLVQPVV